ncbi:9836_t:CDS:2 [Gigaspora margarita]|uniref:9836_t:CDS:1 n=1 Tax=Gigaspora margarita TaxID=4874 RepID=A0ABN7V804_GIGMA|nr:9836_t:CDS:2 [Gigaspora margarita]
MEGESFKHSKLTNYASVKCDSSVSRGRTNKHLVNPEIKDHKEIFAHLSVLVYTQEAQDIFDAMKSIIVLDEVIINPPYDIDNCKTSKTVGSTELLARVRKVLGEKRRLANGRRDANGWLSSTNAL